MSGTARVSHRNVFFVEVSIGFLRACSTYGPNGVLLSDISTGCFRMFANGVDMFFTIP